MMSFAASASLFLAFIATGNAIECEVCSNRASLDCSGDLVTCDQSVESCQTAIAEYSFEGLDPIYNVFKNCSDVRSKNTLYRSAEKHGSYYLRVEVCKTNGCNKSPLEFPPKNTALNGVRCPTCSVDGDLSCEATEILDCVGEMTSCIYHAAQFRVSAAPAVSAAFRGCTSAGSREQLPVTPADTIEDVVTAIISKGV
ncbi:phospholipase A2 inhibitor and Ly6/PLAUR domain-containing protein-like [Lissotriton helveticus]|uniref:Sodefrin-like factor 3 n=1 Tax=Lissotriton helveticus TaxID=256425 RepID=A0A0B5H6P2_9SALA|nr:sodefrin precursor-like factor 3 [Lissotriton helveticus]